ncbi:hypothetical protein L596_000548 [Steinernema carpocapsae]|uniref:Uncharacterized protein n=1 Tax=Steinernema carpocapsae TaxID=34508 RepID=A0A4V6I6Y1_STECR|nr:hypothetical protein L596_000548 [Steinernema carpocapsae]
MTEMSTFSSAIFDDLRCFLRLISEEKQSMNWRMAIEHVRAEPIRQFQLLEFLLLTPSCPQLEGFGLVWGFSFT